MFSCKYCKIFKNAYFEEHLRTTASAVIVTYYDHKVSNYVLGTCRQKLNVEWFLLRRFLDLVRDIRILTGLVDRFCPLRNFYFSDMSIKRWRIFYRHIFHWYTSGRLLLKFVEYLSLESFFFGKICFALSQMFNVKIF